MRNQQQYGIGEYSTSPSGQGCLWLVLLGVVVILASAYMSVYKGTPDLVCDRLDAGCRALSGKPYREATGKDSSQ